MESWPVQLDGDYLPVDLETLDFERASPCDLFRRLPGGEFVFFAQKGLVIDGDLRGRLQENRTRILYVREEEGGVYHEYLQQTLVTIVRDPVVDSHKKAEAVLSACRQVMRRVFDDPRAVFIQHACGVIEPTVDLILADDQATRHLVKLTSYDRCTAVHSTNVGIFGVALSRFILGSDRSHDMHRLGIGFFLHDLGKCKIPIEILNKPGPLTTDERRIVNCHVLDGYQMLDNSGLMTDEARTVILEHHERDDGHGYPHGKLASGIHPYARICRLADIYEALTSDRPYHQRRSTFEALKLMKEKVVTDLDEALFAKFVRLFLG
jgi:HD-GYP domain-containing protein (c-di-GMP phosphodiesterase class II)